MSCPFQLPCPILYGPALSTHHNHREGGKGGKEREREKEESAIEQQA